MPVLELAAAKTLGDKIIELVREVTGRQIKAKAEKELSKAIADLLSGSPNLISAGAKIQKARSLGILTSDLLLAEDMLNKHKTVMKKPAAKKAAPKKAAAKPAAKTASPKKA